MPKNATTIIKHCLENYLASSFDVQYSEDVKDLMFNQFDAKTYSFTYGNGKVFIQKVKRAGSDLLLTIHDKKGKVLLCQWLTYEYKYMMQELEDSCKVLLDCAYIGFDIFDVYNNDYYIDFRPGTPAYEIDIDDEYEQGTTDVTDMIGYVFIAKSGTVISDVECDWISSNDKIKTDSVYYAGTNELCLAFDVDSSVTQTLYFSFYYSSDNMFSDKEFSKVIYSGSVTPVANGGKYQYQFTLPASEGIEPGYYYVAISESAGGGNIAFSACQVTS